MLIGTLGHLFYSIKHQLFLPSYKNTYNGKSIKLNSLKIDHVQEISFSVTHLLLIIKF